MSGILTALTMKRCELEEQLERNEEKGGSTITLTKGDCEELFEVMYAAESRIDSWGKYE